MTKFGNKWNKKGPLEPLIEVSDIYLNLDKAALAVHADYMFPLMRATNDCILYAKYGKYLMSDFAPNDLIDFATRNGQAQMYEALQAFVVDILPVPGKQERAIFKYLMSHPKTEEQFNKVRALAENSKMMSAYKKVRNKLVFHYDVEQSHTRKTLTALAIAADKQPRLSAQPLIRSAGAESRFFCSDIFTSVGWTLSHDQYDEATFKIAEPVTLMPDDEYYRKYADFSGEALGEFYFFGLTTILTWIEKEGLVLDIAEHKKRFKPPFSK